MRIIVVSPELSLSPVSFRVFVFPPVPFRIDSFFTDNKTQTNPAARIPKNKKLTQSPLDGKYEAAEYDNYEQKVPFGDSRGTHSDIRDGN